MEWKEKIRRWCSRSERSILETKLKLKKLGATQHETEDAIKTLENEGFISESRYVSAFVHDHFRLKNWGPRKLFHALRKKGCPAHLIEDELSKISENEVEEALQTVINARLMLYPEEHMTHRDRLIRYLQNRGYTLDNILSALSRL